MACYDRGSRRKRIVQLEKAADVGGYFKGRDSSPGGGKSFKMSGCGGSGIIPTKGSAPLNTQRRDRLGTHLWDCRAGWRDIRVLGVDQDGDGLWEIGELSRFWPYSPMPGSDQCEGWLREPLWRWLVSKERGMSDAEIELRKVEKVQNRRKKRKKYRRRRKEAEEIYVVVCSACDFRSWQGDSSRTYN